MTMSMRSAPYVATLVSVCTARRLHRAIALLCILVAGGCGSFTPGAGAAPGTAGRATTAAEVARRSPADSAAHARADNQATWWRGNMHTHSLWSDGEDFPEMIAAWYREHGYHFIAFTEHDMLQEGVRWVDVNAPDDGWPPRNASARSALPGYRERFGTVLDERIDGTRHLVRLRPLAEYRASLEEPGRFLLLMGEEITDRQGAHVNVIEAERAILPQGGAAPAERIRNNLEAVAEHGAEIDRRLLAMVNHPNFLWSLTAEEIAAIPEARFFEVYNGHSMVYNEGDAQRAGTEQIWDVVLTLRLASGGPLLYGIANDDAHHYRTFSDTVARPGRGWVRVRADSLDARALTAAMLAGDFHASTGVALRDVRCEAGSLVIDVEAAGNASYRVAFIGTRRSTPLHSRPVLGEAGDTLRTTRIYDAGVGEVLAEVEGTRASYAFRGDELYVRARVESSAPHIDPTTGTVLGRQRAWTQPILPAATASGCASHAAHASDSDGQATRVTE
jgi:hypothetical protein